MNTDDVDSISSFFVPLTQKYAIIKAIYLAGSSVRKTDVRGSDIDVTLIIDDTSSAYDPSKTPILERELKLIRSRAMSEKKYDLHIQPPKTLSLYWDLLRSGEPWVFTELRDSICIFDPSGFIEPLKVLLEQGRISGTPEKAHSLITRAHDKIRNTRKLFLEDITSELLLAMTESAQAVIMYSGMSPPNPRQVASYLKEYVGRFGITPEIIKFYDDFYNLTVKIDHGTITDLKGSDIDRYLDESMKFIHCMESLFEHLEANKKKGIIDDAYLKAIEACKNALKENGTPIPAENYQLMIEFKRHFIDTKIISREHYIQMKNLYTKKKAIDDGRLNELSEKDVYSSNIQAKNLEIAIGDVFNAKKETKSKE